MRFFLILSLVFVPGFALAQAPTVSADEAVARAIQNNPRLSAAIRDVTAARSGVRSAQALTNPNFVFTPGITSLSGTGDELVLSQPLELNGARSARTGVAGAQLKATEALAVVELRELVFSVRVAYYQLAQARAQQTLAAVLLSNATEFDRISRRLVDAGARPGIELAQTGLEVSRAQQQVILADAQTKVAAAALNTLLGLSAEATIAPIAPLSPTTDALDEPALLRQALASRAEIANVEATREGFQQEARLARAEGRPDLSPQIRFGSLIRGVPEASSGNGFGIGLGISLPIFDYGSRRNRIRQAEDAARAQTDRITATQNQVRQEVTQAIARLRAAQQIAADYQGGVLEQARRLLDASQTGFQEGQTSIVAVLEARRTYAAVQTEYLTALTSTALARAELERATGTIPGALLPTPLIGKGTLK
ncbi:MAG: putative cobalt-zinc-cadmium resistance protein czcC [Chthonomonadales bacterium]|nr:putative cobalt-zinc-cadmium resistance protein czcC [Chthonomonadales bacterium]